MIINKKLINFYANETETAELDYVVENAKECGLSMSQYCNTRTSVLAELIHQTYTEAKKREELRVKNLVGQ